MQWAATDEDGDDEGTCGGTEVIDWVSARLGFDLLASAGGAPTASQLTPDICHKHHKQRLCKITTIRVKFYFLDAF